MQTRSYSDQAIITETVENKLPKRINSLLGKVRENEEESYAYIKLANKLIFNNNERVPNNNFVIDSLLDAFLSGIMHKIDNDASEGIFVLAQNKRKSNHLYYASKVYGSDSNLLKEMSSRKAYDGIQGAFNFYFLLHKRTSNSLIDGLLKSIVYRIIIEDWDNKLDNYAAYPTKEDNKYKVMPFDYNYSLGRTIEKSWSYKEIESIFSGQNTYSNQTSVVEALAETLGYIGMRTSTYYSYHANIKDHSFIKNGDLRDINKEFIVASLDRELAIIHPDRSIALISVFKDMLQKISSFKDVVKEKVIENTVSILGERSRDATRDILNNYSDKLEGNINKFRAFIKAYELKSSLTQALSAKKPILNPQSPVENENQALSGKLSGGLKRSVSFSVAPRNFILPSTERKNFVDQIHPKVGYSDRAKIEEIRKLSVRPRSQSFSDALYR